MNRKIMQLAERRMLLIAKSSHQRQALADAFAPLHKPAGYVDRGINAVHTLAHHPVLLIAATAAIFLILPRTWLAPLLRNALPLGASLISNSLFRKLPGSPLSE